MAGNTTAQKSNGTVFSQGAVVVGLLNKIKPPEKSADTIDVTTIDVVDGYKKFIAGFKDGGEVTVGGYFAFSDVGQLALDTAYEAGTEDTYTIKFPTSIGATYTFSGIVTKYAVGEANPDDALGFEATIKVAGKPVLAASGV